MTTLRADWAVRPAHLGNSVDAYLIIVEITHCLLECLWCVHTRIIAKTNWLVKYIIVLI
jgi:hypothetical protein